MNKIIYLVTIISTLNFLLVLSITLKLVKRVPQSVFYTCGFYMPFIFGLFILAIIIFDKNNRRTVNWATLAINIITIVAAYIYLQDALLVK